jgi:archaeal cell division control protein 6
MNETTILKDKSVFGEAYLPPQLIGKGKEFAKLRNALDSIAQGRTTKNVWLHGPPGSGKTAAAKLLLNYYEDRFGIQGIYANCWETTTYFSLLEKMVRDFRILGAERLNSLYRMERIEKHLHARPLLVVLDEIDKPSPRERDTMIYNLCSMPNVCLICICNSRHFFLTLDSRVRSRLDPLLMEFTSYTSDEIEEILRQRSELGMKGEAISDQVLLQVSRLAKGDARVAIQTLLHLATRWERGRTGTIAPEDVEGSEIASVELKRKYLLAKLTSHHKLLYQAISDHADIPSGTLWRSYLKVCQKMRARPVASRTFSLYLRQLEEFELISYRRALGIRGQVRIYHIR